LGEQFLSNEKTPPATSEEELAALRTENEALRDQLETRRTKGSVWRRILAGVLALLAILAVVAAVQAVWLRTTFQDEDQFVATLESLPQNDAVASALSIRVADGVVEAAGVEVFVSEALPEELSFLASPLTNTIEDFIARLANEVIQSEAVTVAWTATLRVTHKAVSAVLTGNDRALVAEDGKVAIDLDQVGAVVLDRVAAAGLDLPDFEVSLGQIVLYEDEDLAAAQAAAQAINTMGWFIPVLALLLITGAIWVSPNRQRMVRILSFGTALALLLTLAALRVGRKATLDGFDDEIEREAAGSAWDIILVRFIQSTWALLFVALIIGVIAWAMGPSERAHRVRVWTSRTLETRRRPAVEEPSGFAAFLNEWKRTIQVVIVVVGLLFVLFGPSPSGLIVIITAVLVLGLVVLVDLFAGPERAPAVDVDSASLKESAD
jgi:hypothetical protein